MFDTKTTADPIAYLEEQVGKVIRGVPVRDLDEAFAAVRARLERAERVCESLALHPPVQLTGRRLEAYAAWRGFNDR